MTRDRFRIDARAGTVECRVCRATRFAASRRVIDEYIATHVCPGPQRQSPGMQVVREVALNSLIGTLRGDA